MNRILLFTMIPVVAYAQSATDSPTGNRTTPPIINSVSPLGIPRGATMEMNIEGLNLAKAGAVYFSEPGIKARILRIKELPDLPDIRLGSNGTPSTVDVGPLPPRNQVTLEVEVSPDTPIGTVALRLETPLGTTPERDFAIEPYYGESPDREPNDTPEEALETYLPAILVGAISRPGDVDYYKINVKDGEQLVFENPAAVLGSRLRPVVRIYDAGQNLVREFGSDGGKDTGRFAYTFAKGGAYFLRVSDYEEGGSGRHFYRIKVGHFPLALAAFPLGVEKGQTAAIHLTGYNLGQEQVQVKGEPSPEDRRAVIFRPKSPAGPAFNRVKIALGNEPEVLASGANTKLGKAQAISVPVTVNARLKAPENYYRFHATKGESLVLEVNAQRLGSPFDSLLEIVDTQGVPIERATIRCVLETTTTLSERDSSGRDLRLTSPTGFAVDDYVMVGSEILKVAALPRTPDDDFVFTGFDDQRLAYLDTTPEAHPIDQAVYKVQFYPPGAQFAPNGLPVVHLPFRNDDGGPGYGKDSLLHFTAPADGDYVVRVRDVRKLAGPDFAYRLTVRHPSPDFLLSVSPRNPNVPLGGRIPITVTALRLDDFDGPIEVSLQNIPAGFRATRGTIAPGEIATTLLLSADDSARLDRAAPLEVLGRARLENRWEERSADPEDKLKLISLMPKADIMMTAETKAVQIEPGGTAEIEVTIQRNNEFGGRVPVEVRNLPPGVRVLDVGLNGVLINETENRRKFTLAALPTARPIEQPIVIAGEIETRAGEQQNSYAAEPIILKVTPKVQVSGSMVNNVVPNQTANK
ncbi:MAG TPA: hypothetical protein VLX58_13950 [Bryobacteraceae bacterium]|nr:hypothetical protein [Bryobacteraceae bacterium]